MDKKKISIIAVVSIFIIVIGFGFNSIFSKATNQEVADNTVISSQEKKDSSEKNKDKEDENNSDTSNKVDENTTDKEDNKSETKKEDISSSKDTTKLDTEKPSSENTNNNETTKPDTNSNQTTTKPSTETTTPSKPAEQPAPEQPKKQTVTVAISCKTAINNGLNQEAGFTHLPSSGTILSTMEVEFNDGETVFDILVKATRQKGIHMEYTGSGSSIYIEGINNLYEFDGGQDSGWMYSVNGWYPNYGCGGYKVKNSDVIKWNYTCDLGKDLGAGRN